jgi:hypothetical protein
MDNKELKTWADALLKQSMNYHKMALEISMRPNAAQMRTALRCFPDDVLIREMQRRNAMPEFPELKDGEDAIIPPKTILSWTDDESLLDECRERDLSIFSNETLAKFEAAIDVHNWEAIKELIRWLI